MGEHRRKEQMQVYILNTRQEQDHFHQDTELFYILKGSMDIEVMGHSSHLAAEGILAVNVNDRYGYRASEDILFARVSVPVQLLKSTVQSADIVFWCDSSRWESNQYAQLRGVLRQLLNRYLIIRNREGDFGYRALCYQLLDILCTHFLLRITDRENPDGKEQPEERFEDRIAQINSYINANYSRPITSGDLAKKLYLSQGYLSRFFRRNYGSTFSEYLTRVRLYHALDDLLYTDNSITVIAYDNGFANAAAFYKAFREQYEETPSAMRKKLKRQKKTSEHSEKEAIAERQLEEYLRTDGDIREEPAAVARIEEACSVSCSEELKAVWADTINIGAASDLLNSELREHTLFLARTLKVRYIRFWNIFSDEMLIDLSDPDGNYNFSRLDLILDFLVSNGLKPHIELGQKPKRLYRNVQSAIINEQASGYPDIDTWRLFLRSMMDHLLRRYHREELNTWRMELWFNESLREKEDEARAYFRIFNETCRIGRQFAEKLEIGGCGLRTNYIDMEDNGVRFLRAWREQPFQPDFLSISYYAYERGEVRNERYSKRSTDDDGMYHKLLETRDIIRKAGMENVRLYVTEWNLTISDRNYINDTCFKGAYILKNMLDCYGLTDMAAYFPGSDRFSEHYDTRGFLHGGSGLLSKDGILKPAGYAFRFLEWLFPYFVGRGPNYLLTTDRHDSYGLVCHNQKALNYNYYFSREDEIQKEHIWKYFSDRATLQLTLRLTDIADGRYQMKTYQINDQTGDALSFWNEMGYEKELTRNDISYLERVCGPRLMIQTVEARGNELSLEIGLAPNEIRFIRIRHLLV